MTTSLTYWPLDILEELDDYFERSLYPLIEDFGSIISPREIRDEAKKKKRRPGKFWRNLRRRRQRQEDKEKSQSLQEKEGSPSTSLLAECEPVIGKDGLQICMNVEQFRPNELTVKTVDNWVIIEGNHEERLDEEGYISRHFVRRYALPEGYDANEVISTLSSDGILTVKAPPPRSIEQKENERIVEVKQTGPAHLTVRENPADEQTDKEAKAA